MDPYYSSPSSYYYHHNHHASCSSYDTSPSCISDSYIDPCLSFPTPSTTYYYPSYHDQTSSPLVYYNNSTSTYALPNYTTSPPPPPLPPQTNIQVTPTPSLNRTFESAPPPGRRRRQRTIFSKDQVDILDQIFEKNQYPDFQLREQISERLDVPEARIQVWFKNRRSRAGRIKSKY